ncbi:MAG: 5-(carboxyamino)imidazole ribonucleotide mutase [Nanoarchaeota archaeon]|nr:5-(carboxyamino)imidazole ribonucleotide mutase [Nanoarchaeota archaeon]
MAKVLVVFGSKSDETVFNGITDELAKLGVPFEARVCSAHRTPDDLLELLKKDFDVVITGAGLAAHLPGVVASKVIRPIIGVPVNSNFEGLDSLLSIMQMPPGIPVMSVGVGNGKGAATYAALMLKPYKAVYLQGDESGNAFKKAIETLEEFGVPYETNASFESNQLTIKFVGLDEPAENRDDLIIYVPLAKPGEDKALASLNILKNSQNGLWVGLNRGENAALAAVKIMNLNGSFTEKIKKFRKTQADKVRKDDAEVRGRKK